MTTTTEFVAQYCNDSDSDLGDFTDLSSHASTAAATSAIEANILNWQIAQHQSKLSSGRPAHYRVLRRQVIEEVVAVRTDPGLSLLEELGRENPGSGGTAGKTGPGGIA